MKLSDKFEIGKEEDAVNFLWTLIFSVAFVAAVVTPSLFFSDFFATGIVKAEDTYSRQLGQGQLAAVVAISRSQLAQVTTTTSTYPTPGVLIYPVGGEKFYPGDEIKIRINMTVTDGLYMETVNSTGVKTRVDAYPDGTGGFLWKSNLPAGQYTGVASRNGRMTGSSPANIDPAVIKEVRGLKCYMYFVIDMDGY